MKLGYKILWFEDNIELANDYGRQIKRYLDDYGFDCTIIHKDTGDELEQLLESDNYDLIMTDLNLSDDDDETGNIIIERIRSHRILTEVLFYSGNSSGIEKILKEHTWIERVSFSVGIESLLDKIKELIYLTIKKLQEVNNIRGLVMAETSELDLTMLEIICRLLDVIDKPEEKSQEIIDKTIENRYERIDGLKGFTPETVHLLCERLESYDKLCAIQRLIKYFDGSVFESNKGILSSYNNEIILQRNILAHAKEIKDSSGDKKVVSNINGKEFFVNDKTCSQLRKDIRKHRENFENMLSIIDQLAT
ncbi:response regulator [Brevibacillus parabrevis]|uniref:response regulator n=1 Tax=Brevibacillus parabrevis TaxID=54914 RepID=UPI001C23CA7A|nr:response regulator [Brevibacillus parabrevis]MBU8716087.1 response regulator [Brevibacillus parabrevis]